MQYRRARGRGVFLLGLAALLLALSTLPGPAGQAGATTTQPGPGGPTPVVPITVNGAKMGPTFQGIGAISGGGGNTRLLVDYPPKERQQILEYLFKPDYGASLQILKLEIGGDGNSSDGSEPSVEHSAGHVDCQTGYEFWLAQQALKLNPNIKIYALQWAAPAFARGPHNTIWGQADLGYVMNWLGCARKLGVPISYIGGWNEHYPVGSPVAEWWYETLRKLLDLHGYKNVQIVAADAGWRKNPSTWAVSHDMAANARFDAAVSVIGAHDICGALSGGYNCQGSNTANALAASQHKLLWQSELGHTLADTHYPLRQGPGNLARSINNSYIDANTTGTIMWPLLDAMPADLPYENRGLVLAGQPWSGNYQVSALTWVTAQTTQATEPGWRFVLGGDGFLPGPGGSYVSYEAPNRSAWSTVVQTSTAQQPYLLHFHVIGRLSAKKIQVWRSTLEDGSYFAHLRPIVGKRGYFSFKALPGRLYTFTTLTNLSRAGGQHPAVPRSANMPVRYTTRGDIAYMPTMVSPMEGAFTAAKGVIVQRAVGQPVSWFGDTAAFPYAVLGSKSWQNYTVSADVSLPAAGPAPSPPPGALLIADFEGYTMKTGSSGFAGYEFSANASGAWQLTANGPSPQVLTTGIAPPLQKFKMSLTVDNGELSAALNGTTVATAPTTQYPSGQAGLGTTLYDGVSFSHFAVTAPARVLAVSP